MNIILASSIVEDLTNVNSNILQQIKDLLSDIANSVSQFFSMIANTQTALNQFKQTFNAFINQFGMWSSLGSAILTSVLLSILFIGADIIRDLL